MTRRDEGYGWYTDDEPAFSRDESQGPVEAPRTDWLTTLMVAVCIAVAALAIIFQVGAR